MRTDHHRLTKEHFLTWDTAFLWGITVPKENWSKGRGLERNTRAIVLATNGSTPNLNVRTCNLGNFVPTLYASGKKNEKLPDSISQRLLTKLHFWFMNPAHVIVTCEAHVTLKGSGRRVPFDSPEARSQYPYLAEALDDLPLVGAFVTDPRADLHRRDPNTEERYKGTAPAMACQFRGPQGDASVTILWEKTWHDETTGYWQGIAAIYLCKFGTQTVDNPSFPLGHRMDGEPILLADVLPKGCDFAWLSEEDKKKYTDVYKRPVTRAGMSAYKPAGIHLNSKIAGQPHKARLILVPFFMQ